MMDEDKAMIELQVKEELQVKQELQVKEEIQVTEELQFKEELHDTEELQVKEELHDTEELQVKEELHVTEELQVKEELHVTEELQVKEELHDTEELQVKEELHDTEELHIKEEEEEWTVTKLPYEKIDPHSLGTRMDLGTSNTPNTTVNPSPVSWDAQLGTSRSCKAPHMCAACGKATTVLGHFVHNKKIFCQSTSEGVTLEEWIKKNVPRTTRWRWKVKEEKIMAGIILTPKKHHTCSMCKKRMTRDAGHSVHKGTRQSFCQATDPWGRTVEEWLTEIRGGVSTKDFIKANLKKRWRRYHQKPDVQEKRRQKRREQYLIEKKAKELNKQKKVEEEK